MATWQIPLEGRPPQIENSMQALQGAMSLRQAATQNQLTQQQIQAAAMQNQMTQMNLQQQQLFMAALRGDQGPSDDSNASGGIPARQPASGGSMPLSQTAGPAGMPAPPTGANATMPLSQAVSRPPLAPDETGDLPQPPQGQPAGQLTGQPAGQSVGQPTGQSVSTPQANQQGMVDPNIFGQRMADTANRYLQKGGNPLWLNQNVLNPLLEQQTKIATLSKDQQAVAKQKLEFEAGALNAIAAAPADAKPQMWSDHVNAQLQNGRINNDQAKQLLQNMPTDDHLIAMANAKLGYSDQIAAVEKQAQAQLGIARAQDFKARAAGQNIVTNSQVALATMPQDPSRIQGWASQQSPDVQHVLNLAGDPTDPATIRRVLTAAAVPLTEQQKVQQSQEISQLQEGANIADRGNAAAYGEWLGGIKYTNPTLYNQLPPASGFSPKTYGDLVRRVGLTPEQTSNAENQSAERAQGAARLGIEGAQLQLARQRLNNELGTGTLAERQGENLVRAYEGLENKASQMRDQIGTALTNGNGYVDDHGTFKPWSALGVTDDEKTAMQQDMRTRYRNQTEDALQAISDKNRVYARMNQAPGMSTSDAQASIIQGARSVLGNSYRAAPAAQPAPPPTQTPTPAPTPSPTPGTPNTPTGTRAPETGTPRMNKQRGNPPGQNRQQPPANFVATVPEGRRFQGPDGSVWVKKNGKAIPAQ